MEDVTEVVKELFTEYVLPVFGVLLVMVFSILFIIGTVELARTFSSSVKCDNYQEAMPDLEFVHVPWVDCKLVSPGGQLIDPDDAYLLEIDPALIHELQ